MAWWNRQTFGMHVALSLVAGFIVGVSAEVLADTVYTWTTEDGTVAFTDEDKRVPARYRDQVRTQPMEGLDGYHRFTRVQSADADADVADVVVAEGGGAVATGRLPQVSAAPSAEAPISVISGGTRYGANGVVVPVAPGGGSEPLVVEDVRIKPKNSMATTHATVIKRGDEVVGVIQDEISQRDDSGMVPPVAPNPLD